MDLQLNVNMQITRANGWYQIAINIIDPKLGHHKQMYNMSEDEIHDAPIDHIYEALKERMKDHLRKAKTEKIKLN